MSAYSATSASAAQASERAAKRLSHQLAVFLAPLLRTLDQRLDRRLVGTFLATLIAIVQWRNRAHGLLLSELGAYLLTPEQAPAGTKRLSNLLRSPRWSASLIADWLWQQAEARVLQQSAPSQTHSPRLLQSARRSPDLCPRSALVGPPGARPHGCADRCGPAVVDKAW